MAGALLLEILPERLYRPDASITAWRKLCDDNTRGEPIPARLPTARRTREPVGAVKRVGKS